MKRIVVNAVLLSAIALAGMASGHAADKPEDFAYGTSLSVEGSEPYYQIALPDKVYTQSVWPDLRDVRVFNGQGQNLPFAWLPSSTLAVAEKNISLRVYKMNRAASASGSPGEVSLRSGSGLEVTLRAEEGQTTQRAWLLETGGKTQNPPDINQIRLEWDRLSDNWQTSVDVLSSNDLKSWYSVAEAVPLMDLKSGSDRLLLNALDVEGAQKYWLILARDPRAVPKLNIVAAQAVVHMRPPAGDMLALSPRVQAISAAEAHYFWAQPQPLNAVRITPAVSNSVLPLEIEYRSSASDSWHPLAKQVAYAVRGYQPVPLALNGEVIQGIRLKGIHQQWGDDVPEVTGLREKRTLAFNAQGNPPFLLAWGNNAATPQALSHTLLLPPSMPDISALPLAYVGDAVTLGGEARLTATDPAQRASLLNKILLWGVLLLGVAGLVVLMLRVWREFKRQG
ncbi:hypothetical protein CHU32_00975 [Superficieibacter electus]|uniref:DUF3999 domain-containing protein n=1 Tax=Superficieibacter electus TaxID=2022662 RepID=A0A2P5GW23_9ENTR|nr:DUF3999 family protein [Superficieibacter electus]POP47747.1 hypothetical protein CHU33_00975 [Superficieibacter electus]POP50759.1 hypothetical protein CHU32_00975 [Superficieibacter electus]